MKIRWKLKVFRTDVQRWDSALFNTYAEAVAHMGKCQAYGDMEFHLEAVWAKS
ncbi:hypothetical protein [Burkholderia vietnamiensis]|uniref:hypothetical protein n=1 Tax=Burkholderia vietnamiensis TaxID=60552 RepID=UPI0026517481|nr:hypothetical protein [Burkholderia vietnamiensis]MDN8037426.1 hypothetical protein [Burkholderia vietnamiensis]